MTSLVGCLVAAAVIGGIGIVAGGLIAAGLLFTNGQITLGLLVGVLAVSVPLLLAFLGLLVFSIAYPVLSLMRALSPQHPAPPPARPLPAAEPVPAPSHHGWVLAGLAAYVAVAVLCKGRWVPMHPRLDGLPDRRYKTNPWVWKWPWQ